MTARNIFAVTVTNRQSEAWIAPESFDDELRAYDHVALMAMPYLEAERRRPTQWLMELATKVAAHPDGLARTVFELQSVDWARKNRRVDDATLTGQIQTLRHAGVQSFGYYPDDFLNGRPSLDAVRLGYR